MFLIEVFLTALGLVLLLPFPRWKWYWKAVAGLLLTVTAFKFHVMFFITHDLFSPSIPMWLQVGSGGAFAAFFIMTALAFINISAQTIIWVLRRKLGRKDLAFPRKHCAAGNLVCAVTAVCISALGCINGMKMPVVREHKLYFPHLPEAAEGLRIAVISDLHVTYTTDDDYVAETVRTANTAGADLIVFAGDNADGKVGDLGRKMEAVKDLQAPLGVWGVTGNHEYYQGRKALEEWLAFYQGNGMRMLFNESVPFREHGIVLGGVPDETANGRGGISQDFGKVFAGADEDLFRIILVHRPAGVRESSKINADLQISGHTHGGMLPGLNILVALFNDGMDSGIFNKYGVTVALSNGTGIWSGFPLRINCPTEIMLLELHKGENL